MMNRAIICVDDEQIVLNSLESMLLRKLGKEFDFEFVQSGEEALEVVNELRKQMTVAVFISDWLMPNMLGDELLSKIKDIDPEVKTIILSGQIDYHTKRRALSDGSVDHFFDKPWDDEELVGCILS